MAKKVEDFIVTDNQRLSNDFFILNLGHKNILPDIRPGQFVQALISGSPSTYLRRPFSVHDIDTEKNTIKLLVQVAGSGTRSMSCLRKGDTLNLVYPLGNSFTLPGHGEKVLLAGGGCGIAPLLFLGKTIRSAGFFPDVLLGFRNKERIIEYDEYRKIGQVFITTEDGSEGEKGMVNGHSVLKERKYDRIYCCGPESMMKALALYSRQNDVNCEVSLENLMACGIGACLCCVTETVRGNVCTCIEGPVFNTKDLKW